MQINTVLRNCWSLEKDCKGHLKNTNQINTMGLENQEVDSLFADIISILETQLTSDSAKNVIKHSLQNAASEFRSIQIINEAKTISKNETVLLEGAALLREEALVHLRNNEIEEGKSKLEKVGDILTSNKLSAEASLIFSTFQSAAESFLHLKNRAFIKAYELMETALETHRELFENYGHRIEVRRIHLGRNMAKILSSNNKTTEAFKLSTLLIKYTITDSNIWPLDCCIVENPNTISSKDKMFVVNQLVNELIDILSQNSSEEIINIFDGLSSYLKQNSNKESEITLAWCNTYKATLNNDRLAYLKNAKLFFQKHDQLLPIANQFILTTLNGKFLS